MENKIKPIPRVSVETVTPDPYLARALQTLSDEGLEWLHGAGAAKEEVVRVILVDTACLGSSPAELKWLLSHIREANAYAFMSYSGASFDEVPHLRLDGPVAEVSRELVRVVTSLATGSLPGTPALFSRLNASERQLAQFLTCGYDVKEIQRSMGLNIKTVYRIRTEMMKKYRLANRLELYVMLRVYKFMREMKAYRLPLPRDKAVL